jgi:outer membrane protein OmpA-like peptidoglycan-associated protein
MSARQLLSTLALIIAVCADPASADTGSTSNPCWIWDRNSGVGALVDLTVGFVRWAVPWSGCTTESESAFNDQQPTTPDPAVATRTVPPGQGAAMPAPEPVAAAAPPAALRIMELPATQKFVVTFAPRSAQLDAQAQAEVAHIVTAARQMEATHISTIGYPDPGDSQSRAMHIATMRAHNVKAAIIRAGFDATKVTVSVASAEAAAPTGASQNCRVAIAVGD